MSSRNRFVRALGSATSHVWFPGTLWFARHVPRRISLPLARSIGGAYFRMRPKYLSAIRSNLARILGEEESAPRVRATAEEMVRGHSMSWFDFLHFANRPPEGKQPIHVVLVPDIFPGVERERQRLHARAGVTEIPIDNTPIPTLAVMRALEKNGIVAMQGDRDFNNTGVSVPFFAKDAWFPRGPFRVAMATGAEVLPAFILRTEDGRYRAIIEEPLEIERGGDRDEALRANLARYVAILERYVGAHPEQWYCFYPFWDDPSRASRAPAEEAAPPVSG